MSFKGGQHQTIVKLPESSVVYNAELYINLEYKSLKGYRPI
jgi:hypothetical protein